jgi:hypothetical protein
VNDCCGRRRAYSQRNTGSSIISRASAGVGTLPRELDILAIPLMPTNAYIGPIGCQPPKISLTRRPPTTNEDPGAW